MTAVAGRGCDLILARYGELWLKGKNRREFERALVRNVKAALRPLGPSEVQREHGQLVVRSERRPEEAARRLGDVFGIASISRARAAEESLEAIVAAAQAELDERMEALPRDRRIAFRVSVRRSEKRFPLTSPELERHVAEAVLVPYEDRVRVDLVHPELVLGINVRPGGAYVFAERRPGAGGLPVGSLGRAVCLLSGGIDSPVAAWLAMKRGCAVTYVSFHSAPYLGESSKRKIVELVRALSRYQPRSRLVVVPFTEAQTAIRDRAPEAYRTVLYRRMMQRIGCGVAEREGAGALVTGESLGQVASQTLENLTCIEAASTLPVLRPLISFDKSETIALAQRIGTYGVSIQPEPDCCTVFQPSRPIIRGRLADCERAEQEIDVEGLVRRALEGAEVLDVEA